MGFSFPLLIRRFAAESDLRKHCGNLVTALTSNGGANSGGAIPSGGGASDASPSGGDASPNGGDAIGGANGGPSALPRV